MTTLFATDTIYFFGTFNPIHVGHIMMAHTVLNWAKKCAPELTTVSFIVSGNPPHRQDDTNLASANDRLKLVHLALDQCPHFRVLNIECQTSGPHYSADTLSQLHPGFGHLENNAKVPLLMGSDSLSHLPNWYMPKTLTLGAHFLQITRPEAPVVKAITINNQRVPLETSLLAMPPVDISASWIRQQVALGNNIQPWLEPLVWQYIQQNKLYQNAI